MKFTPTHEWIHIENDIGTVGVTYFAQKELGDIVYVELPDLGREVKAGQEAVVLESTKAAADVYSPVTGKIIEVNKELGSSPEKINQSPEQEGWLFKIQLSDPSEIDKLMGKEEYNQKVS